MNSLLEKKMNSSPWCYCEWEEYEVYLETMMLRATEKEKEKKMKRFECVWVRKREETVVWMCASEKERKEAEEVWMWERERRSWRGLKEVENEELCMGHVRSEIIVRVFDFWFKF